MTLAPVHKVTTTVRPLQRLPLAASTSNRTVASATKIYCLIRRPKLWAASPPLDPIAAGLDLIAAQLQRRKFAITAAELAKCVVPVFGDLSAARLGLSHTDFTALASKLGWLYHCAWDVNLVKSAQEMATNLRGLESLIEVRLMEILLPSLTLTSWHVWQLVPSSTLSRALCQLTSIRRPIPFPSSHPARCNRRRSQPAMDCQNGRLRNGSRKPRRSASQCASSGQAS